MPANCPQCGNQINEDFGVVTCSRCQSVLFVDMDGNIQITEASFGYEPVEDNIINQTPSTLESNEPNDIFESEIFEEPEYREISPDQSLNVLDEHEDKHETPPEPEAFQPIVNVSEFANSDLGLGALTYSVKIERIDTMEIRQLLKEILSDSRFQWDSKELMKSIEQGQLRIENISPTKASVLIQKISELSVKVSWKQNAFN